MMIRIPTSKKVLLTVLGVTAVLGSRTLFFFFDDPEGPNLLVVMAVACVVYLTSLPVFLSARIPEQKRFRLAISSQIIVIAGAYLLGLYI